MVIVRILGGFFLIIKVGDLVDIEKPNDFHSFQAAVAVVQPSTKREGFSAIPTVKWEDVGALDSIQKMMDFFITRRIKHPEDYEVT